VHFGDPVTEIADEVEKLIECELVPRLLLEPIVGVCSDADRVAMRSYDNGIATFSDMQAIHRNRSVLDFHRVSFPSLSQTVKKALQIASGSVSAAPTCK